MHSQLFNWRQKGDYDDFFDFDEFRLKPYFVPVEKVIKTIEEMLSLE